MPILKRKYDHVKVYRPNGTPYAEGEEVGWHKPNERCCGWNASTRKCSETDNFNERTVSHAAELAIMAFETEFGRFPNLPNCVVEIVCGSFGAKASIFEIPDEPPEQRGFTWR